jgi:virginiamycin B lyase
MPALSANAQTDLKIVEHVIPTPRSMPHSIAAAPDGRIYFSELAANKIGVFDPRTGQFAEAVAPTPRSQPHGVAVDPRTGTVYVTQLAGGKLMQYKAPSEIREFDIPTANSAPHTAWPDRDGNMYFTEAAGVSGLPTTAPTRSACSTPQATRSPTWTPFHQGLSPTRSSSIA